MKIATLYAVSAEKWRVEETASFFYSDYSLLPSFFILFFFYLFILKHNNNKNKNKNSSKNNS